MEVPAAATAAATGAAGWWCFDYNRENYQYDSEQRFARFVASRGFANAQVGQYREDIHGLTEMTVSKMDTWQSVCTLFLCVCAALSCAGRLGMHGAAPPGWLCALYSGNIFTAILFCGLALWLAMHASLRAQCGMVSLLTRKVRLPIPTMGQIDQARAFGSAFEQQKFRDIFRVPFLRHPQAAPQNAPVSPEGSEDEVDGKSTKDGSKKEKKGLLDPSHGFASTGRDTVPSWIRDEQVVDKGGGLQTRGVLGSKEDHESPEHFKLMARAMEEWWMYDVYARISMLYGVICFLFAVTYYSVGTSISELRGFWISWSLPMLFLTAQALILRLDILRDNGGKMLPNCEWLGHIAPYFAITGTTLEFRWFYSPTMVTLTWVFVILAFFGHFMMALRMLDLAWPSLPRETDAKDEPTKQWWPKHWRVPTSFTRALWFIAPPKKLEPGVHDLCHEMEELQRTRGGIGGTCRRRGKKGGGSSSAPKPKAASPQALYHQCNRIDRLFRWWFDENIWAQVPERSQRKLHELYNQYQPARREVDMLDEDPTSDAAGSGSASPRFVRMDYSEGEAYYDRAAGATKSNLTPGEKAGSANIQDIEEHLGDLGSLLAEIDDGLTDVEAGSQVRDRQPTGNGDGAYTGASPFKDFGSKRAPDLPWQLVRVATLTVALQWFYMMVVSGVECVMGPESLLKPPGEPPWIRDQKMRVWSPAMVHLSNQAIPDGYELFKGIVAYNGGQKEAMRPGEHGADSSGHGSTSSDSGTVQVAGSGDHSEGSHRRLAAAYGRRLDWAASDLAQVLPELTKLVEELKAEDLAAAKLSKGAAPGALMPPAEAPSAFMGPAPVPGELRNVVWPPLFEPHHVLCGPANGGHSPVLALTRRGFGALARLSTAKGAEDASEAEPFALEGLGSHGPVAGASWLESGLHIVTRAGALMQCSGHAPARMGAWPCAPDSNARLPLPEGGRLSAAAVAPPKATGAGRLAALLLEQAPGAVALLAEAEGSQGWHPAGQVHLPPGMGTSVSLQFDGRELLITSRSGQVHRRHIDQGTSTFHPSLSGPSSREFHGACALSGGALVRLALQQAAFGVGGAWRPELVTAA